MKVAAVSVLCQDRRVYDAMGMAGTPCPIYGKIGEDAKVEWKKPSGKKKIPAIILDTKVKNPALIGEVEELLKLKLVPLTWPIGMGRNFQGVYNLFEKKLVLFSFLCFLVL